MLARAGGIYVLVLSVQETVRVQRFSCVFSAKLSVARANHMRVSEQKTL